MQFLGYLRKIIHARQAEPQDDLISGLLQAQNDGDQLSEDELVAMLFLLLVAGHETTVNLIGSGTLALLQDPAAMAQLRDNPAIIRTAVEELLRFSSPVAQADERYAREDITIQGVTIPRGELVYPVIASANRDETQFASPDTLDLTRDPNRHLAFGQGVHYCLGAPLARLEGAIAFNTLLRRLPDLKLAVPVSSLRYRPGIQLRGLEALPVTFERQREMA
jgi:cytochrome P450 PksS